LFIARLLIDKYDDLPIALMNGLGIAEGDDVADPFQVYVAVFPLLHFPSNDSLAPASVAGGKAVELTAAGRTAITRFDVVDADSIWN